MINPQSVSLKICYKFPEPPNLYCMPALFFRVVLTTNHSNYLFRFNYRIVATASYRLLPEITIVKPCEEELADKLASCFPEGVIKLEKRNG